MEAFMAENAGSCFIVMPITTPEAFIKEYRDGIEHFSHVLECLHVPAVEKAGFKPIPPSAQGSDLIHAEIIRNLETADLVLCDISCFNPNVYFELGVRTALNKPVCFVMDDLTKKLPFDTGILNHKEYKSSLDAWDRDSQVKLISDHIKASYARSEGKNTLWRHLGIKSEARAYERQPGDEGKYGEILFQLDAIREVMSKERSIGKLRDSKTVSFFRKKGGEIENEIEQILPSSINLSAIEPINEGEIKVYLIGYPDYSIDDEIIELFRNYGAKCTIIYQGL